MSLGISRTLLVDELANELRKYRHSQMASAALAEHILAIPRIHDALELSPDVSRESEFVWKWVERAVFDPKLSVGECLDVLIHYPDAPWNRGAWDVEHKPYARAFYAKFPKARPLPDPPKVTVEERSSSDDV